MSPELAHPHAVAARPSHRLFVSWQDPHSREIRPIGILRQCADRSFEFRYLRAARREPFHPLANFPQLDHVYRSDQLFAVFRNRVMRSSRPDYSDYLHELQLPVGAAPFEILAASNGVRATDSIEVFQEPTVDQSTGLATCRFLVRGVRHVAGASDAIARLALGERLCLLPDPHNDVDARALFVATLQGAHLGYVPRYLVDFLHRAASVGHPVADVEVFVDCQNPTGPYHLRLMCRLHTGMPPGGFAIGDLEPIVPYGDEP